MSSFPFNREERSGYRLGLSDIFLGIFVTLKLCSVIDWSWWWVMAPLWLPLSLLSIITLIEAFIKKR
jgi:hypothetical protein